MLPNGIVTSFPRDGKGIRGKSLIFHAEHSYEAVTYIVALAGCSLDPAPAAGRPDRVGPLVAPPALASSPAGSARMSTVPNTVPVGDHIVRNFLEVSAKFLSVCACALASVALAQEIAPDALVKTIAEDVIAAIRQDARLTANPAKVAALVEAKVLPHFDFAHTTRIAMGVNWRRATPEQQERLTQEFRTLLVRTYSTALASYREQAIEVKPLRARPGDVQVIVRSEVKQAGAQAMSIDYDMERTADGWKVFDIRIGGASLAATYRDTFAEIVRNHGVDGLIEQLSGKNLPGTKQI